MQNLMKLLALFIFVSLITNTYAQSVGPKAGANLGSWAGDEAFDADEYSSVTGLQFGVVAEIPVSDKFAIQPELLYLQKGASLETDFLGTKIITETKLNYLEIPILGKIYLVEGPTQVFLNVGPSVGFGLGGTVISTFGDEESKEDIDFEDNEISTFDLSVAVGAGVQVAAGAGAFFVDARYLYGLTTIDNSEPKEDRTDIFNRGIGASVGFLFPIGQ